MDNIFLLFPLDMIDWKLLKRIQKLEFSPFSQKVEGHVPFQWHWFSWFQWAANQIEQVQHSGTQLALVWSALACRCYWFPNLFPLRHHWWISTFLGFLSLLSSTYQRSFKQRWVEFGMLEIKILTRCSINFSYRCWAFSEVQCRKKHLIHFKKLVKSLTLPSLFVLIRRKMFSTETQLFKSFSTKTLPTNPVAPVTRTLFPAKNSPIVVMTRLNCKTEWRIQAKIELYKEIWAR